MASEATCHNLFSLQVGPTGIDSQISGMIGWRATGRLYIDFKMKVSHWIRGGRGGWAAGVN